MADKISSAQLDAEARAADLLRPPASQKGQKRMYHVGLVKEAPFGYITVPTVVLRGTVRGKCVEVPKTTGQVRMGDKNVLIHTEAMIEGRFEMLYDIEVDGFIKYIDSHVFRKTSEYEVPEVGDKGKATGKMLKYWRADIQPKDPSLHEGGRPLHDEDSMGGESMADYVWIVPANLDTKGKPMQMGAQHTVTTQRKNGTFFFDVEKAKKAETVMPGKTK